MWANPTWWKCLQFKVFKNWFWENEASGNYLYLTRTRKEREGLTATFACPWAHNGSHVLRFPSDERKWHGGHGLTSRSTVKALEGPSGPIASSQRGHHFQQWQASYQPHFQGSSVPEAPLTPLAGRQRQKLGAEEYVLPDGSHLQLGWNAPSGLLKAWPTSHGRYGKPGGSLGVALPQSSHSNDQCLPLAHHPQSPGWYFYSGPDASPGRGYSKT